MRKRMRKTISAQQVVEESSKRLVRSKENTSIHEQQQQASEMGSKLQQQQAAQLAVKSASELFNQCSSENRLQSAPSGNKHQVVAPQKGAIESPLVSSLQQQKRRLTSTSPQAARKARRSSTALGDSKQRVGVSTLSSQHRSTSSLQPASELQAGAKDPLTTPHAGSRPASRNAAASASSANICAACQRPIRERYLLVALDKQWHEDCLKCSCCECRLGEVGSSLFMHSNQIFCRRDFLRIFCRPGHCAACDKDIPPYEMVMRAQENAYHMDCFACQQCQYRFCVGDQFHLSSAHRIVCVLCYQEQQQQQQQQQQHLQQSASQEMLLSHSGANPDGIPRGIGIPSDEPERIQIHPAGLLDFSYLSAAQEQQQQQQQNSAAPATESGEIARSLAT